MPYIYIDGPESISVHGKQCLFNAPPPHPCELLEIGTYLGRTISAAYIDSNTNKYESVNFRNANLTVDNHNLIKLIYKAIALRKFVIEHKYSPFDGNLTKLTKSQGTPYRNDTQGIEIYPILQPVTITLVLDPSGRCLLVNNNEWDDKIFAPVSGFVETGESLEDCAIREVFEETGINISECSYQTSSHWPHPNILTVGFIAHTEGSLQLLPQKEELSSAKWFTKNEYKRKALSGTLKRPPSSSVASTLLQTWLNS